MVLDKLRELARASRSKREEIQEIWKLVALEDIIAFQTQLVKEKTRQ